MKDQFQWQQQCASYRNRYEDATAAEPGKCETFGYGSLQVPPPVWGGPSRVSSQKAARKSGSVWPGDWLSGQRQHEDAVEKAASRVEEEFETIDVRVNNAMVSVFSSVKEMEATEFRRVTEVNYLGYVNGTLAALRCMLPPIMEGSSRLNRLLLFAAFPFELPIAPPSTRSSALRTHCAASLS
jgi:NAD(P)-dependent dehydrogenase (short-subunit alcohol dehydrogenase family)